MSKEKKKNNSGEVARKAISVLTILGCVYIYGTPSPLQSLNLKTAGLIIIAFSILAMVVNGIIFKNGETATRVIATIAFLVAGLLFLFGCIGVSFSGYQF